MFKKQEGITLVALVVTIIVLLILAGVSISMILGNNGILNQAERAVTETTLGRAKEAVAMALASLEADYWEERATSGNSELARDYTFADLGDNLGGGAELASGQTGIITDSTIVKIVLDGITNIDVTITTTADGSYKVASATASVIEDED